MSATDFGTEARMFATDFGTEARMFATDFGTDVNGFCHGLTEGNGLNDGTAPVQFEFGNTRLGVWAN